MLTHLVAWRTLPPRRTKERTGKRSSSGFGIVWTPSSIRSKTARNSAIPTITAVLSVSAGSSGPQSSVKALDTVKYFTSFIWKPKFEGIANQFEAHKRDLHADLQFHIGITVSKIHRTLTSVNENIIGTKAMVELIFERMQTPEERELAVYVEENKGADHVLSNAMLKKEVVDMVNQRCATKDDKGPTGKGAPAQTALTVPELEKEILKDVDTILAENAEAFERMFGTIESLLKGFDMRIKHESDRIISEIVASMQVGPHGRIIDRVSSLDF